MTTEELSAALLAFQSQEADLHLRPDPYLLRKLAGHTCSAFSALHLVQPFAGRLREALLDGLRRLDALPRTDPFWDGTNRRPTVYKLRELAERTLERGPKEAWACWAYAAISLLWCTNDFGLPGWRGLYELGLLDPSWPIHAAFHVRVSTGHNTAPAIAGFLRAIKEAVPPWASCD
jgi:hypothetical protein